MNDLPTSTAPDRAPSPETSPETNDSQPVATSYGAALHEIESILAELESGTIDIDTLASKVGRGAELVRWCRSRLDEVKGDVDGVVADLTSSPDPSVAQAESDMASGS